MAGCALFYALSAAWPERAPRDPNLVRLMAIWSGTFLPGFLLLFFKSL